MAFWKALIYFRQMKLQVLYLEDCLYHDHWAGRQTLTLFDKAIGLCSLTFMEYIASLSPATKMLFCVNVQAFYNCNKKPVARGNFPILGLPQVVQARLEVLVYSIASWRRRVRSSTGAATRASTHGLCLRFCCLCTRHLHPTTTSGKLLDRGRPAAHPGFMNLVAFRDSRSSGLWRHQTHELQDNVGFNVACIQAAWGQPQISLSLYVIGGQSVSMALSNIDVFGIATRGLNMEREIWSHTCTFWPGAATICSSRLMPISSRTWFTRLSVSSSSSSPWK